MLQPYYSRPELVDPVVASWFNITENKFHALSDLKNKRAALIQFPSFQIVVNTNHDSQPADSALVLYTN